MYKRNSYYLKKGVKMASVKSFYKRKLLAAKDIAGKPFTAKITSVEPETQKADNGNEVTELVLEVDDGKHRIKLNKTNALFLAEKLGDDFDEWVGKKITVATKQTTFNNKPCLGLDIKPAK